jgi:hypothetical protein
MQWLGLSIFCKSLLISYNLEPLAKLLDPVIVWQALFPHAEAMATFGIDMQFNRAVCYFPCGIQGHVSVRYIQIVISKCDEQRRRVGWHGEIEPERTVDRRHKVRTTLSLVTFRRAPKTKTAPRSHVARTVHMLASS